MKSVTAAELSALGAWRALDVGDRVGLVAFNDSELVKVKPQCSHRTVLSILGAVLRMNHALRIGDGTDRIVLDPADGWVRETIADDYRAEQERITRSLRGLSAPLLLISNDGDVVDQVRRP